MKHGRPSSHHPLVAWLSERRRLLWATLRAGHAGTANGAREFLAQALTMLPPGHQIGLVRADSGFFVTAFLASLDARELPYIIVARLTPLVRKLVIHRISRGRLAICRTRGRRCRQDGLLTSVARASTAVRLFTPDSDGTARRQRTAADRVSGLHLSRLGHQCAFCRRTGHPDVRGTGGQ
ncbi:MAG: transposase [Nitrospira sp.]